MRVEPTTDWTDTYTILCVVRVNAAYSVYTRISLLCVFLFNFSFKHNFFYWKNAPTRSSRLSPLPRTSTHTKWNNGNWRKAFESFIRFYISIDVIEHSTYVCVPFIVPYTGEPRRTHTKPIYTIISSFVRFLYVFVLYGFVKWKQLKFFELRLAIGSSNRCNSRLFTIHISISKCLNSKESFSKDLKNAKFAYIRAIYFSFIPNHLPM